MQHNISTPEEWRPVVGYEGQYEVSNHGRVKSLSRKVWNGRTFRSHGGRLKTLNKYIPPKGTQRNFTADNVHLYVKLNKDGKQKTAYVHTLVLEAFVGPRPPGMECCHNNGKAQDNRLENLRWDTPTSNSADMILHGNNVNLNKDACPRGHQLIMPNLVRALWEKRQYRDCLSCSRARSLLKYHPHLKPDFKKVADSYYEKLMRQESETA